MEPAKHNSETKQALNDVKNGNLKEIGNRVKDVMKWIKNL